MPIAIHRFGSAHWSVLQHIAESAAAQDRNRLDVNWMRCRSDRPAHLQPSQSRAWHPNHGTMLAGYDTFRGDAEEAARAGCQALDHDDWDCVDDLCHAGLVERLTRPGCARLTPQGSAVHEAMQTHLRQGGSIAKFQWPLRDLN